MKKSIVFVMALVLLLSFTINVGAKTVVEFWPWWLSTFEDYLNEMIAEFEAENPDIEIKMKNVDGQMGQVLVTAINANEAPDVVNLNNPTAYTFYKQGILEPLDLYLEADDRYEYFDALWEKTMFDGTFGYTFPWYASPQILIYNKAIFTKAGLDPDYAPGTWEEVLEYSRVIKENTNKYGFAIHFDQNHVVLRVGEELFNDDLTKAAFNTKKVADRLQFYRTAFKEELMPRNFPEWLEIRSMFESGQVAMFPVGVSMVKHIENNSPELAKDLGFAKLPTSPNGANKIHTSMMNLVVLNSSEDKEAAVKWAKFLTSHQAQIEFSKLATIVPSTKIGLDSDSFFTNADTLALQAQTLASISMTKAANLDVTAAPEGWDEIKNIIKEEFKKAVKGEKGIQETLDFVEERANSIIEELN